MARKKENVTVAMDRDMHTKLFMISFVRKCKFGDKKATMSKIINDALNEYFNNHKEDVDKAMEEINNAWRTKT